MKGDAISEVIRVGFVVLIAVISLISKLAKKPADTPKPDATGSESDQARRVRADILRKIAERKAAAGSYRQSQPVAEPAPRRVASPFEAPRPIDQGYGGGLQDLLRERIRRREADEARRAAELKALAAEEMAKEPVMVAPEVMVVAPVKRHRVTTEEPEPTASRLGAASLSDTLADPDEFKRAFVLNEILSRPLALR